MLIPEQEGIIVLDFGSTYSYLVARAIRDQKVFSVILPYSTPLKEIEAFGAKGIVFSRPEQHTGSEDLACDPGIHHLGLPILDIQGDPARLGQEPLQDFLFPRCGCDGQWVMSAFLQQTVDHIRRQVGDKKVLCGLSGGVDSSVAAMLVHQAIGDQLTCVFVDHGLLRKGEAAQVEQVFKEKFKLNLIAVNAAERFLTKLAGITDPERKRKIIGEEFIRVFEEEGDKLGQIDFLVQGTLYPDVVESSTASAKVIKSHHNVGGLPQDMRLQLIEPLYWLFKDEVRLLGAELGMPEESIWRQPFPGPGLGVRILGEVTATKVAILQEADAIFTEEIRKAGLDRQIWQYFAILPDIKSVGVTNDQRSYSHTIALRAITTQDAMTANWVRLPYDLLETVANRITNEVKEVNRVVYDITTKPPATIEWE